MKRERIKKIRTKNLSCNTTDDPGQGRRETRSERRGEERGDARGGREGRAEEGWGWPWIP